MGCGLKPTWFVRWLAIAGWEEVRIVWAMLAMVSLLVLGFPGSARGEPRAHLGQWGALSRALQLRGVQHCLVVRRGGGDGGRGGERRALHDPIVLTIVMKIRKSCMSYSNIHIHAGDRIAHTQMRNG